MILPAAEGHLGSTLLRLASDPYLKMGLKGKRGESLGHTLFLGGSLSSFKEAKSWSPLCYTAPISTVTAAATPARSQRTSIEGPGFNSLTEIGEVLSPLIEESTHLITMHICT